MNELRRFSCVLAVIVFGMVLSGCASITSPAGWTTQSRPNVLFVLTDDLRHDALGAYGNPRVSTPHLDQLAGSGLRFDRFYVAAPVCHPSRASFLSGLYPHQEGLVEGFIGYRVREGTRTVATELNRAGYATGFVGKAHLGGNPRKWGFREVPAYTEEARAVNRELEITERRFVVRTGEGEDTRIRRVGRDTTRFLVDEGIEFVRDHRGEPWFLWLATTAPHSPYFYSDEHPYAVPDTHVPPGFPPGDRGRYTDALDDFLGRYVDLDSEAAIRGRALYDDVWSKYYSNVSTMDRQLGRLLEALEETGQAENTVVVFTSDNGIMHGSHGLMNKGVWYEEATRVPAIVRWPGVVQPGRTSEALVSSVDFMPTVLRIAGVGRSVEASEGRSFLPVLQGRRGPRRYVFSESRSRTEGENQFWQMVRGHRFKYVEYEDRGERYLYDLLNDPHEETNLAGDTKYRVVRDRLRESLQRWRSRTD